MLGYQHGYHAGNFADVLKHAVLTLVLETLGRKDAPLCYLDTHAGRGIYDLEAPEARKTREYQTGIGRLWHRSDAPPELSPWLEVVRALNPDGVLRRYPGSPELARRLLRPHDRLALAELHPAEYTALRTALGGDRRVGIHRRDGYEALPALVPPRERRGLVLVDPSYERADEPRLVTAALAKALARWPTGVYALWYPHVATLAAPSLQRALAQAGTGRLLRVELDIAAPSPLGMYGSGLLLVNPPWRLHDALARVLPWLWCVLAPDGGGGYRLAGVGG